MGYAVETGIPLKREKATKYPWAAMTVGSSFFVPSAPLFKTQTIERRVSWAARGRVVAYPGEKYTVRTVEGGVRVWRTA